MLPNKKTISLLLTLLSTAGVQAYNVHYNVIHLVNNTYSVGVKVDNVTYPLHPSQNASTILYTGEAPVAKSGYQYVKIQKATNKTEIEPFLRQPVQENTVNEFFNRTWNSFNLSQFPVVYPPLDTIHRVQSNLHIDGQIPTIHILANQTEIDTLHANNLTQDISVISNMTYVSLNDTLNFANVEISLSGRSSRWFPKLSYNIKLHKDDRLYSYKRIKLRALATDPSYIREQLAYDVLKSVGLASSEFSYCRFFMNQQEIGLFGLIDTFKNPWLADVFDNGNEDYENGNLYQGIFGTPESMTKGLISDLSFHDNLTLYQQGQYEIKQDASFGEKNDFKPLQKLTEFIHVAPNSTRQWKEALDVDSFLRSMALEVLLGYSDGYLTMADNFYVYQNPNTDTFFYISSDMDMTQGSTMFSLDDMWNGNYSSFPNFNIRPLTNSMLKVPEFKQQYEKLLVHITQQLTNLNVMNSRIDDLVDMLQQDVAWDSLLPRVSTNKLAEMTTSMGGNNATSSVLPSNMNITVVTDFALRLMYENIPFKVAVDGPTGHSSLSGVKQWYQVMSENTCNYFNVTL